LSSASEPPNKPVQPPGTHYHLISEDRDIILLSIV
jgi:hypothetical protein